MIAAVTPRAANDGLTVSVVIATYRRPDRLAACLTGLRAQTRPPAEVIVVLQGADGDSADVVRRHGADWPAVRAVQLDRPGVVAALNAGLAGAAGDVVAYIDDDAVADETWLERIAITFAQDARIAAVGGRDVIDVGGRILDGDRPDAASLPVGRLRWFGRMHGHHHAAAGPARDVDVLKGVNMSFRRAAVVGIGFDERLRGRGAQIHHELSICLPLRRRGLRVVYDPAVRVNHFPAPRAYGDARTYEGGDAVFAWAHNEALQVLDHFGPLRRLVYVPWWICLGTSEAPGLAVLARDLLRRDPHAWRRFMASQRGRGAAWRTRRQPRPAPVPPAATATGIPQP